SERASDTQSDSARSSSYERGLAIDTIHAPNLPLATKRTSALSAVRICFTALFEDPEHGYRVFEKLARREQHHGDVAFRSGLVLVIVGPLRCHDRPHALLFFGRRSPRQDRNHFVPHLDLHIGVGKQVFVPPRMVGSATLRSDNQIVVALAPVDQRELFRLARFPPDRMQHQTAGVVPIVANPTAGRLVPADVLVSEQAVVRHGQRMPPWQPSRHYGRCTRDHLEGRSRSWVIWRSCPGESTAMIRGPSKIACG